MDQDLSYWLHKHQAVIERRWWAEALKMGLISEASLERLAQEDLFEPGSFRHWLLASVSAGEAPDPDWVAAFARELKPNELLALISALRRVLFELLAQQTVPENLAERWSFLSRRVDQIGLAVADAVDARLIGLDAERRRWQALYDLTYQLTNSIDLSYVLQNAIGCLLDAVSADGGAVLLLESQTNRLTPRAAQNWPDVSLHLTDLPPEWQRGHNNPNILEADDAGGSAFQEFIRNEIKTVIAAPLLANGRLQGILILATSDPTGFDPQQLELINVVVNNLASSLASSEVIQTLDVQARELGVMLRQHQEESIKREAILASIADGVVFNDRHGRIVLVNRAAELILNTRAEELIGCDLEDLFDLFTTGARDDILQAMSTLLANPQADISSGTVQTGLQIDNFTINAHWSPVITTEGEFLGIVTVLRDITREVEAEQAKDEFVSTVSHELRTPMTAIKGYTDLLHDGMVGDVNDEQKRFLGIIRNNADRLTALISDLLDISRIETGRVRFEPEPLHVGAVVKQVIDALTPNAEKKGHSLALRVEAGLPEVMGDPDRLNQVFVNLLSNAINYTPEGGQVHVDVYTVEGAVRADVTDSGIGIHSDDLSKIFERFYRASHPLVQESRGTGLGLPIVKMFVEMHGGRVWAASDVGKGSTFTVLLPLPTAQLDDRPELVVSDAPTRPYRRHVLVADDDPDIANLVKLHLEGAGFRVTLAGRGVKVLDVARRQNPDLIVLDILLPDMDGRAVLETLKSEPATTDIPIVMLTVLADDGTASDLGAADYLTKPIEREQLLAAVWAALSRRGRVLVVEDDENTIEMMRLALRRVGYNVDAAADGYEALSLARSRRPHAILLDLRLPGMDGYETLSHLKRSRHTHHIPIIATSGHVADLEKEKKRLESMGVVSFLPKPFRVNQLVAAIDQVTKTGPSVQTGDMVESPDE